MNKIKLILLALVVPFIVHAEKSDSHLSFSGIPALGVSSDEGFGSGVIGNMYINHNDYLPYKASLGLKIFLTTKGVQSHMLSLDQVQAFGLPLRLTSRVGFYSTVAANFCGYGSDASCDMDKAADKAKYLSLSGKEKDDFLWQYYKYRYKAFFAELFARWRLNSGDHKFEIMTNYRMSYFIDGDFSTISQYKNSYFDNEYKDKKTSGLLGVVEFGVMMDSRDNEPAPTSGYWLETSFRGGAIFTASEWNFMGANATFRFYLPFDQRKKLVLASQSIADMIVGDLPFNAMSRLGGTHAMNEYSAIGGKFIGRGISEQLYVGKVKLIEQLELRYNFWSFNLFNQDFDLNIAAMLDACATSWDYQSLSQLKKIHLGFGGGLRVSWNKNFIIRADTGVSPDEGFSPKFYLTIGNVF